MKGYLFISNSGKPDDILYESVAPVPIGSFDESSLYAAKEKGYKLYRSISRHYPEKIRCSTEGYDITYYDGHIYRDIFAIRDNLIAYRNACRFLDLHPDIDVIHCNTPIGGVIGRLIGYKYKKTVIYTAHGFHFFKRAPLINWILFYPIEYLLARLTDVLITINEEDYIRASHKFHLRNDGKIYYIPGVGIDICRYVNNSGMGKLKRKEIGIGNDTILIISVGRLDKNKNTAFMLRAISKMKYKNVHYIICGTGNEQQNIEKEISVLGLRGRVHLLGNRTDVIGLYSASDIFAMASFREGLSRSIMEAMSSGLPCVVSKIRGNTDLIDEGRGGYCIDTHNVESFAEALDLLAVDKEKRKSFGIYNRQKIKKFSLDEVKKRMLEIFENELP